MPKASISIHTSVIRIEAHPVVMDEWITEIAAFAENNSFHASTQILSYACSIVCAHNLYFFPSALRLPGLFPVPSVDHIISLTLQLQIKIS